SALTKTNAFSVSIANITDGYAGTNQFQRISYTAFGGTFKLSFQGKTTSPLDYNITAAALKTALEGLSTIGAGNVDVVSNSTGIANAYLFTVEFKGTLANTNEPLLVGDGANLGSGIAGTVSETQHGSPGVDHKYRLRLPVVGPGPVGQGYDPHLWLRFKNPNTQVVSRVQLIYAYNYSLSMTANSANLASYLQTQIQSMDAVGSGNVIVTPANGGQALGGLDSNGPYSYWEFDIEFAGALGDTDLTGPGYVLGYPIGTPPSLANDLSVQGLDIYYKWVYSATSYNLVHSPNTGASPPIASSAFLTEQVQGSNVGKNEKQTIALAAAPKGGTFTLTMAGQTTAPLAYNIS